VDEEARRRRPRAIARAGAGRGLHRPRRGLPLQDAARLDTADAIVAEVEFDTEIDLRPNFFTYLRARVRRVIQGDYSGTTLLVRLDGMSCETPFGNGMSGFLVGTPDGMEDGVLVVVPVPAPRRPFESLLGALQLPVYAATHNKS
jgi:hypothetical protein